MDHKGQPIWQRKSQDHQNHHGVSGTLQMLFDSKNRLATSSACLQEEQQERLNEGVGGHLVDFVVLRNVCSSRSTFTTKENEYS
jgi:hypothetical protein